MSLFTTLTNKGICQLIETAKRHVILAAPGISSEIAEALLEVRQRLGNDAIQVVVDVSAQVARLGYGSHAAVELLEQAGVKVRHQPGMRIGALICDNAGWSFASCPALVEADPATGSEAYNAIALTEAQVMILRSELPPVRNSETQEISVNYPLVGSNPIDESSMRKVKKALEIAPPQSFDLARQTQVYAALIQFVELKFEGFNIQSRRIQLPKTLPLIASKDKALKERVSTSLKVLDKIEKPKALIEVTDQLEELRHAYLVPTGQAGRVILKSKRAAFEQELAEIERALDQCKLALTKELQQALDKVVDAIAPDLARAVLADPPPRFRGLFPLTEEYAMTYVKDELAKAFPSAQVLIADMKIHKFYKDVTYETLKNKEFEEKVMREIPKSVLDGALLQEELAAKTVSPGKDNGN